MRKIFTLILALLASVGTIFAADAVINGIWYDFDSSSKTAIVTYFTYPEPYGTYAGDVIIPSSVRPSDEIGPEMPEMPEMPETGDTEKEEEYRVIRIGDDAFRNSVYLRSVTIPNSVTSIGENAFSGCSRLTSVTINSSDIVSKNYYSIHAFKNLKDIFGNQVKEYIIGENVTSIGSGAFYGCTGLTSMTIPNSVTSIGDWAFAYCTGLIAVTIPNSVTSIGEHAFYDVPNINVSKGVSVAGSPWGAKYVNGIVAWDMVYNEFMTSVVACSTAAQGARNIVGPVITIESNAFYNCTGLTSVTIPNSVTNIGNSAFYGCTGLTSMTIPNSVTSIGGNAFTKCTGLPSITIPNSVTSIEIGTFINCSSLNSVTIGKRVTNIGNGAFYGCGSLTSVTNYAATPQIINSNVFEGVDKSSCTLYVLNESLDLYKEADEWKDFGNIIALYDVFPKCSVTFLDYDGSILSEQEVEAFDDAIPPTDPSREGYTFVGWDKDYHLVTEDMVITAQYEIQHFDVIFKDWDGTILKQQTVDWNSAATPPDNPSREDYTFIGWDRDCSHVTEDMVINALYGYDNIRTLLFQNGTDNSEIAHELIIVRVPEAPSIVGFTFLKWVVVGGDLDDVITIQAVYTADSPTSAPEVVTNPANPAQKLIRNGNVYILTGDKTYTVTGQEVK